MSADASGGLATMGVCKLQNLAFAALLPVLGLPVVIAPGAYAGQIPSSDFFHLRRGMSESEVLVRAGAPDLVTSPGLEAIEVKHGMVDRGDAGDVTFDSFRRTRIPTISQWHYVPGPEETDPFITIITFRAGEIWELERTKVFTRYKPKSPTTASDGDVGAVTDTDIQRQRADAMLKAAEAYAATRAKLKEQAGQEGVDATPSGETVIYMHVQPDGSTYFGDTPPGEGTKVIPVN